MIICLFLYVYYSTVIIVGSKHIFNFLFRDNYMLSRICKNNTKLCIFIPKVHILDKYSTV